MVYSRLRPSDFVSVICMAHQSVHSFQGGCPKFLGSLKRVVPSRSGGSAGWSFVVRAEGLEPPCLSALDPKSSVSTNFTTPAKNAETSRHFERSATLRISYLLSINRWYEISQDYRMDFEVGKSQIPLFVCSI